MHKNNIFKYQEQPGRLMDKVCWVDKWESTRSKIAMLNSWMQRGGYTILQILKFYYGYFGVFQNLLIFSTFYLVNLGKFFC